jgi:predicted regulator of Ras-like GTPase activity (Roadblock/LC7/MglB family)
VAIRYRYYEEAPGTVALPAGELLARLPGELGRGGERGDRIVEIPCGDLLAGNTPRIALSRLQELAPDLVQIPEGRDPAEKIALPPGWIAMHFKLETRREELPPEEVPIPPTAAVAVSERKPTSAVADDKNKAKEPTKKAAPKEAPAVAEEKSETKPTNEAVVSETVAEAALVGPVTPPVAESSKPKAVSQPPASGDTDPPKPRRGLFASLPIFRRRPAVETPGVEAIQIVPASEKKEAGTASQTGIKKAGGEEPKESAATLPPPPPRNSGTSIALEPLWKLDPQDQLADPTALQALFMTEEKLTLDRIISKAGELPGLKACVLAHGDRVLCTSNTAPGLDLKTLSGQAMTMLGQIRESSSNMGLGAVPAVTLHAEQGTLSFLHKGELCLLVLHAERGFVPGVRERLQEMLGHLAGAKPVLSSGDEHLSR